MHNKLVVILGPTASGKTDLSIRLAKKYHGQIVSADSRQVYKGLNIGSGKITKTQMQGIKHYMLDIANPKQKFSVSQYQTMANKAIKEIQKTNHIPFLVGGTGFYIQSIVDGIIIPEVPPNWKLRQTLEKKTTAQLYAMLKKLDLARARTIDPHNPRRLIRAIEIVKATKHPVQPIKLQPQFETLQLGIAKSPEELKKLIHKRLLNRIKAIITEVKKLHKQGVSFRRLEEFGLEYRFVARLIGGQPHYASQQEMIDKLQKEIEHYAKRQMTWFKRNKNIYWIKNQQEAERLIKKFLSNNITFKNTPN